MKLNRLFLVIMFLTAIGKVNYSFSQEVQDDIKLIKILRTVIISDDKINIAFNSGEMYVSHNSQNGRKIKYYSTDFFIPYQEVKQEAKEKNYEKIEKTIDDNNHFKGEWKQNHIFKRMLREEVYYHIDASWFPEIDTTQIKIFNFYGDPIITLDRKTKQTDINKSQLRSNDILRVVIPGKVTQLYKIPKDDSIPVDENYYEEIIDKDGNTFFWEKESGYLYKYVKPGNLEIEKKLQKNEVDTIMLQMAQKAMVIKPGSDAEEIDLPLNKRSFFQNKTKMIIFSILLIIIVLMFLFKKKMSTFYRKLMIVLFPYEKHQIEKDDTLESLSSKFDVPIDKIRKANHWTRDDLAFNLQKHENLTERLLLSSKVIIKIPKKYNVKTVSKSDDSTEPNVKDKDLNKQKNNSFTNQEELTIDEKYPQSYSQPYSYGKSSTDFNRQKESGISFRNNEPIHNKINWIEIQLKTLIDNVNYIKNNIDSRLNTYVKNLDDQITSLSNENNKIQADLGNLKSKNIALEKENYIFKDNICIFNNDEIKSQIIKPFSNTFDAFVKLHSKLDELVEQSDLNEKTRLLAFQMKEKLSGKLLGNQLSLKEWEILTNKNIILNPDIIKLIHVSRDNSTKVLKDVLYKSIINYSINYYIYFEEMSKIGKILNNSDDSIKSIENHASQSKVSLLQTIESNLGIVLNKVELFNSRKKYLTANLQAENRKLSSYLKDVKSLKSDDIQELFTIGINNIKDEDFTLKDQEKYTYFKVYENDN